MFRPVLGHLQVTRYATFEKAIQCKLYNQRHIEFEIQRDLVVVRVTNSNHNQCFKITEIL